MGYSLDLSAITLQEYLRLLRSQTLLPGRRMLHEQASERFALLSGLGLHSVLQLKDALKTPQKLAAISIQTGIPEDYLILLRRELGSLAQQPVMLSDFPDCDADRIRALSESGIRNSRDYWERDALPEDALYALCDLARINGVGAIAARAFYEAGYASVSAVAQADAGEMLRRVSAVNAEKGYYKAKLGEKDMQFCIDSARLLVAYS